MVHHAHTVNVSWSVLGYFTGECLDTQCLRTFRTLFVAARLITNSLSPFLWSVGNPAENTLSEFLHWVLITVIHTAVANKHLWISESVNLKSVCSGPGVVYFAILGSLVMLTDNYSWTLVDRCVYTSAGEGHPPIFFLGRGALICSRCSDSKGGGSRQGTAVIIQLSTRGHHHAIVVGKQGELYKDNEKITLWLILVPLN